MANGRNDLEIKIGTSSDVRALEAMQKNLETAIKRTKEFGGEWQELEQHLKKVDTALKSQTASAVRAADSLREAIQQTKAVGGDVGGLQTALSRAQAQIGKPSFAARAQMRLEDAGSLYRASGGGVRGAAAVAGSALGLGSVAAGVAGGAAAGGIFAAKKGLEEYAQAQERVFSLDSALREHGNLTDDYREKLQGLAGEYQRVTGLADDQWIDTITRLTQFGAGPDQIEAVLKVTKDVAGIFGGDLNRATNAVTRALGGNFQMFSEVGLAIDQSGTQLEKWNQLAREAARVGGGQLEAANAGLTGGWKNLKNSTADAFEALGRAIDITGLVDVPLKAATAGFNWLAQAIGGVIPKAAGMDNAIGRNKKSLAESADEAKRFAENLDKLKKSASDLDQQLSKEFEAGQMIRNAEDEHLKAAHEGQLAFIDAQTIPDEAKTHLKNQEKARFERQQFQRQQQAKQDEIALLEKQIANEDAAVKAAAAKLAQAELAVKRDAEQQGAFEQETAPLQKEISELTKRRALAASSRR